MFMMINKSSQTVIGYEDNLREAIETVNDCADLNGIDYEIIDSRGHRIYDTEDTDDFLHLV